MRLARLHDLGPQTARACTGYSACPLLRFDLDGRSETIRQLQDRMALDEKSMSAQLGRMLERGRNRELESEAALGTGARGGVKAL